MINFDYIWQNSPVNDSNKNGIDIGTITHVESTDIVSFYNRWCKIIANLIQLEKKHSNKYTERLQILEKYRMCTFEEFEYLHNQEIEADLFPLYHVFKSLNCYSTIERSKYRTKYEYGIKGYMKFLKEKTPKDLQKWIDNKYQNNEQVLPLDLLQAHSYLVAPTTSGKTTLLKHLIYAINKTYPSYTQIILDPHGELSDDLMKLKLDRFVFLDLDLKEGFTYSFNLFDIPNRKERTLRFAIENLVDVFNKVIETKFSGNQKGVLQHCVEFLMEREKSTIIDFIDLLKLKPHILDEAKEFSTYFRGEFQDGEIKRTRNAIARKWDEIASRGIRNILQGESTVRLKELIDQGKTVVFNLSSLPPENSRKEFGKMLLTYVKNILFERGATKNSNPVFLYIDECQVFVSNTYSILLSQMRKFGVRLILANQYFDQLGEDTTKQAVKQNTAIKIIRTNDINDASSVGRVPESVLNGSRSLRQYEFISDIWYREPTVFKSTDFLLKSDKYFLSESDLSRLKEDQLERYYRPIVSRRNQSHNPLNETNESKKSNDTENPLYDLHINEEE